MQHHVFVRLLTITTETLDFLSYVAWLVLNCYETQHTISNRVEADASKRRIISTSNLPPAHAVFFSHEKLMITAAHAMTKVVMTEIAAVING